MADNDDLVRADMWASMSFRRGLSDDERMRQICKILSDVIFEKEHPIAKKILSTFV